MNKKENICLTRMRVYWCILVPPQTAVQRASLAKLGGGKSGNPWLRFTTSYSAASWVNSTLAAKHEQLQVGKILKTYYTPIQYLATDKRVLCIE